MPRRHLVTLTVFAVLIACSAPTSLCACPPARTHFLVFGDVQKAGVGVANARVSVSAALPFDADRCDGARGPEPLDPEVRTGTDGRFRAHVYSIWSPAVRCIRVTAHLAAANGADSIAIDGLLVQFRIDRESPDSLGLVMKLP